MKEGQIIEETTGIRNYSLKLARSKTAGQLLHPGGGDLPEFVRRKEGVSWGFTEIL